MINGGFTLDGVAAKDLGIIMISTSQRPVLPPTVDRTLGIPGRNGAWDFGADVGPRPLSLDCALIEYTALNLQLATERIAAALVDAYGKPKPIKLVFDLRPDRYYTVRYSGSLEIDRVIGFGRFTLPFVAFDPSAYAAADAYDVTHQYDSGSAYNSGLHYPNPSGFDWTYSIQLSAVENYSPYATPLSLTITGAVSSPKFYVDGDTARRMEFTGLTMGAGDVLEINAAKYSVKLNGANALHYKTAGDFIPLLKGVNGLVFEATGTVDARVDYDWQHKYL